MVQEREIRERHTGRERLLELLNFDLISNDMSIEISTASNFELPGVGSVLFGGLDLDSCLSRSKEGGSVLRCRLRNRRETDIEHPCGEL